MNKNNFIADQIVQLISDALTERQIDENVIQEIKNALVFKICKHLNENESYLKFNIDQALDYMSQIKNVLRETHYDNLTYFLTKGQKNENK